jgi:hypothetical protein
LIMFEGLSVTSAARKIPDPLIDKFSDQSSPYGQVVDES